MSQDKQTEKVLIIEDDSIQARRLENLIQRSFPGTVVDRIATELEFRQRLPDIRQASYRVALVDMMLRWTDPSGRMEQPPPEILEEGFFVGGLRCRRALVDKNIPSIIFTVHDEESFPQLREQGIDFVQKGTSFEPILTKLNQFITRRNPPQAE